MQICKCAGRPELRPAADFIFRISYIRPIAGGNFSLLTGLFREHRETQKKE